FGQPSGLLGWAGGRIMARTNWRHAAWAIKLLQVRRQERVVEIGFGPGVAIQLLADKVSHVAGVDPSCMMLRQAEQRNAAAIRGGRVTLRRGLADHLPFADAGFDAALAVNSMQLWPDAAAGLRELRRVLRPGGRVAFVFTAYSGQSPTGVPEMVMAAGF